MSNSPDRILTTHVGALPHSGSLWDGTPPDTAVLQAAVADVVRQQRDCGVDIVNEGELTKGGSWTNYLNDRLSGYTPRAVPLSYNLLMESADWIEFKDFYRDAIEGGTLFEQTRSAPKQVRTVEQDCTSAITYTGQRSLQREIDGLKAAVGAGQEAKAFLTATAPASIEPMRENRFYPNDEAYLFALAEALRVEYEAIVAAGFQLQVDDAWLAALWDRIGIPMGLGRYKDYCRLRIEALNHALRNIPEERIRYHLCWGSWHGPHSRDIEMREMVELLLSVKAQTYLFEAANARHEHEFSVWRDVRLPSHKILAPGVVSHATPLIEHRELVALRIERFADIVGRERVVASTDCGLGLRCHPQIAWAKLKALSAGASLASERLWKRVS